MLFCTCYILPDTKGSVATVYQENLEHRYIRFMRQSLAASHHTISSSFPVMITDTDAVTYIIYATAQINLIFERTINICQHRRNTNKRQHAMTTCFSITISIFLQCYPSLQSSCLCINNGNLSVCAVQRLQPSR